jgi:acyl-ACP thioesterase
MMENYFEKEYSLRYFEMNNYGIASPTTILTLLEETAAEHCRMIEHSLYNLEKRNIGWVLISGKIDMIRYPRYKETINIKTWLSKYSLVKGYRENIILDDQGNIIGKAKGIWVFFDTEKRKPVPIFNEIKTKWGFDVEEATEINFDAIQTVMDDTVKMEFDVYKSDLDSYKHVNNIKYLHWLIDSMPDEIQDGYFLNMINAKFYSETKFGEKIQIYISHDKKSNTFLHNMKSNLDHRLLSAACTKWEKI